MRPPTCSRVVVVLLLTLISIASALPSIGQLRLMAQQSPPACPTCGAATVRRVAESGKVAGRSFWICTDWPHCKGFIHIDESDSAIRGQTAHTDAPKRRVRWADGTIQQRPGWVCSYQNAGGSLRSVPTTSACNQPALAQCWIARPKSTPGTAEGARRLAAVLRKVLQRGSAPPLDPSAERALLRHAGLEDQIEQSPVRGDLSPRIARPPKLPSFDPRVSDGDTLDPDPTLAFDSDEERMFYTQWLVEVRRGRCAGPRRRPRWTRSWATMSPRTAGRFPSSARRGVIARLSWRSMVSSTKNQPSRMNSATVR